MTRVYVVGTADTKGDELAFLADAVAAAGVAALRVDIGTRRPTGRVDVTAAEIASPHPQGSNAAAEIARPVPLRPRLDSV